MKKDKKQSKGKPNGLKRSEEREHRVKLLAIEIRSWLVTRHFRLHKRYACMAEDLMTTLTAIMEHTNHQPEIHVDAGRLDLMYMHKGWTINLTKCSQFPFERDDLTTLIWNLLDTGKTLKFKRVMRELLPDAPDTFYRNPERWSLGLRNAETPRYTDSDDDKPSDVQMIVSHLATMMLAYAMQREIHTDVYGLVEDSVVSQVKAFVLTGKLKYLKVENLDLETMNIPKPMLFMGDDQCSLVLKHSRFCQKCGVKVEGCFCHRVDDQDGFDFKEQSLVSTCWPCTKEMISRSFSGEFTDKFPKDVCDAERDEYFEGFMEMIVDDTPEKLISTHANVYERDKESIAWAENYAEWFRPYFQYSDAKVADGGLICGLCRHNDTEEEEDKEWIVDGKECLKRAYSDGTAQGCQGFHLQSYKSITLDWKLENLKNPEVVKRLFDACNSYYTDVCDPYENEDECTCPIWGGGD